MMNNREIRVGIIHKSIFSRHGGGGAEIFSLELASALKELGFRIIYITGDEYNWEYYRKISGVNVKIDGEILFRNPPLRHMMSSLIC